MGSQPARRIPIAVPFFGEEERAAVQDPLKTGWVVQGPHVAEFERRFAAFTDAPHAVATTSCTTALHIAVAALGLQPGDEVLVPAFTWIATANVVEYQGATPVFVDVDLATYNVDPAAARAAVTERTVGMIPVHLFGLPAPMDPLLDLARERGLWVVEDAACGLGARYQGRHVGTLGDAGAYSFHPRKSITTGEGGMLTTARDDLASLARALRDHGAAKSDLARHEGKAAFLLAEFNLLGFNYRMTDIQGALGVAQMERAAWILDRKAQLAARYTSLLEARIPWLRPPHVPDGDTHGWQAYVTLFAPGPVSMDRAGELHELRNRLLTDLEAEGISTRQGTHAPVILGYYARKYRLEPGAFPAAYLADRLTVTLPLYPQMTEDDQDYVVERLEAAGRRILGAG